VDACLPPAQMTPSSRSTQPRAVLTGPLLPLRRCGAVVVALTDDRPTVFFGDASGQAYAIDALNGKPLWQIRADDHPAAMVTGAPAYFGGRLYVPVSSYEEASGVDPHYVCCTFRGSLVALDGVTGRVVWKTYTIAELSKPGKPTRLPKPAMPFWPSRSTQVASCGRVS
jgi:outer membrane protein assembly factor BamB